MEGLYDGLATFGLHRYELGLLPFNPTQLYQLLEPFVHANCSSAATCVMYDSIRSSPSELLCRFKTHGLLAFRPVRRLQSRQVKKPRLLRHCNSLPRHVVHELDSTDSMKQQVPSILNQAGPIFVNLRIDTGEEPAPKLDRLLREHTIEFRKELLKSSN